MIELLKQQPGYIPNEPELAVAGLTALLTDMQNANTNVVNAQTQVSISRAARNLQLYHPETGLVRISGDIKNYIRSVFTINSPQFKQVSKLFFRKPKEL